MAFDYVGARTLAKELITTFGGAGSFVKKGSTGGYDSSGNLTPDTPDVVITGLTTPLLSYKNMEIDGSTIISGDSYLFFHSETAPTIGMQTTVNGIEFRVVDLITLTSVDNINVYRKIQLRK